MSDLQHVRGLMVGTSRCDVRAACSGATPSIAVFSRISVPPATARAGTARRAIPTVALNSYLSQQKRARVRGIRLPIQTRTLRLAGIIELGQSSFRDGGALC